MNTSVSDSPFCCSAGDAEAVVKSVSLLSLLKFIPAGNRTFPQYLITPGKIRTDSIGTTRVGGFFWLKQKQVSYVK